MIVDCHVHLNNYHETEKLDEVKKMIRYMGSPHKLLFGTDWPISEMGPYTRFVEKLLGDDARELVMWKNAAAIFKLGASVLQESAALKGQKTPSLE